MVLYQSNILVTILIGALQVGQGALSLFKVWPHSKQQLACPQSRRTHFLLLSSKQMTHLGISSSSLPSSSIIGWLISVDSTSVVGSVTTKGFATARTPYYSKVLWTIDIRVMNEEISLHKQGCLSFLFCCDTTLVHASFGDLTNAKVWQNTYTIKKQSEEQKHKY